MKYLFPIATMLLFSGCISVQMVAFDKESNTVTFQGEEWTSKEDYQKEADTYCGKKATLIKMNQVTEGSSATVQKQSPGTTNAQIVPIKKNQYTFKCK